MRIRIKNQLDPQPHLEKQLYPVPDPEIMNADPQP